MKRRARRLAPPRASLRPTPRFRRGRSPVPSPTRRPSPRRISSAVVRSSVPRWPSEASRRIARVMSSTSAATSAGRCAVAAHRRLARPELALERDRAVDHGLDGGAVVRLGAQRGNAHRHAERGGAAAFEQEAKGQEVVVERLERHRRARARPRSARRRGRGSPPKPPSPRVMRWKGVEVCASPRESAARSPSSVSARR